MQNTRIYSLFILCVLFSFSCKKKNKENPEETTFEKKEIMIQLSDNYIVPNLNKIQTGINSLSDNWQTFLADQTESNFDLVKNSWENAYKSFQSIKMFDLGPFSEIAYSNALGTFPSDTVQIENNVTSGNYDLSTVSNISAIGFSALDYLFFKNDALILLTSSINRRNYVSDVILKMKNETNYVVSNWNAYSSTFKEGTGTSSTSPFSMLVNDFCKDYEILKTAKLGIPLGKQSLGIQRPEYLEARKSGIGKELIVENLKALKTIFLGNSSTGAEGKGLDDYLIALDKESLATTIKTRFEYLINEPSNWSMNLENMISGSTSTVDAYYTYIHNTVPYIKTDMASAFGILITYQDNDGD